MCLTFKLAKVFPRARCEALSALGGELSVLELQHMRVHLEQILMMNMERGDYLFSDLSLSDVPPHEAFPEGDPRREAYLDRASIHLLCAMSREARVAVKVRRLQWRASSSYVPMGDVAVERRAQRKKSAL